MDNSKKNDKRAESSSGNVKTELSDEEISKVSGGRLVCATGKHIATGKITV